MNHRVLCLLILLLALTSSGLIVGAQPPSQTAAISTTYLPLVRGGASAAETPRLNVTYDPARAAHAQIGPEGGTLRAAAADGTTFELSIPPDALDFTETITMTPALSVTGLPLSGGLAGAVNLEPAGLGLYVPAALRVTPASAAPAEMLMVGFTFGATGDSFHLRPLAKPATQSAALQANNVVITSEILWIRPEGVAWASRAEIQAQLDAAPALTDAEILELYESALDALSLSIKLSGSLQSFYQDALKPHLIHAVTSPATLDQAIREYDAWIYFITSENLQGQLATEIAEAKALLEKAIATGATSASLRCYTQHRPEEGFAMLRWARYARKYLPGSPIIAQIEAELAKCLQFKLTFHSTITAQASDGGYVYELKAEVPLHAVGGATRAIGSAPLNWLDYRWTGATGACSFNTSGTASTFDAAGFALGLSIAPVSYTSPAVKVNLRYNPGKPLEHLTIVCPGGSTQVPTTSAWSNYFTNMHIYEFDSAGINTAVEITNVGTFTGWVYHHDMTASSAQITEDTQIDIEHTPQQ